jgi:two-component system, LytTR family, response regulator
MMPLSTEQLTKVRLSFQVTNMMLFLSPAQIIRLEAKSSYTKIFYDNMQSVITSKVLKEYEPLLKPLGFIRTHRSHLVNKNRIVKIDGNGYIFMDDLSKAEISRRKRTEVLKQLQQ